MLHRVHHSVGMPLANANLSFLRPQVQTRLHACAFAGKGAAATLAALEAVPAESRSLHYLGRAGVVSSSASSGGGSSSGCNSRCNPPDQYRRWQQLYHMRAQGGNGTSPGSRALAAAS